MFRKTLLSAMAVVILATSVVSTASASDFGQEVAPVARHNGKKAKQFAAGAAIGIAAALIGASLFQNERREQRHDGFRKHKRDRFVDAEFGNCFEKPVRKFDPYYGEKVIVGYRTVCR